MKNNIFLSVVMSVYNGEKFLREAINSILRQTYQNFEFIIINDGATDQTESIIRSYKDPRIRYIKNEKNIGLAASLNLGLKIARGKYIARMDADDISLPQRLEKEINFLEANQDYGIVGSVFACIDQNQKISQIVPVIFDDEDIKMALSYKCPFGHGTVIIRKSVLLKYNLKYPVGPYLEDYRLWVKMGKYTKFKNLPEVLYLWRESTTNLSSSYYDNIQKGAQKIKENYVETITLSKLNILDYYFKSQAYDIDRVLINKSKYEVNFLKDYQYFLLQIGLLYLKKRKVTPFLVLIFLSITLKPSNYLSKISIPKFNFQ